jgi:hypothetical protein
MDLLATWAATGDGRLSEGNKWLPGKCREWGGGGSSEGFGELS